jgi:hypothetical protein
MRKLLAAAATVAALAVVGAGGVSANTDGQVIASGFKCTIYDGNGAPFATLNSVLILYQHKVVLRCIGDGAGARPTGPIYFNNGNTSAICNVRPYGFTADWSDKVGYNGNSQLTCTKPLPAPGEPSSEDVDAGIVE